jgi:hypothetical protein
MARRALVIGSLAAVLILIVAVAVHVFFPRAPYSVRSARVTRELPGMPGASGFAESQTPARPGEEILVVTVRIVRDSAVKASDFTLRLPGNGRSIACSGLCPVDDPEHHGGLWMLADQGQDISMSAGFKSGYLHLAFLVPDGTREGLLWFRQTSLGSVSVRK